MNAFKLTAAAVAALVLTTSAFAEPIRLGVSGQGSANGFRINDVLANTPAADIGLKAGERIVTINNTVIRTGDVLRQTLADANAAGGHVTMLVQDASGVGYVLIECDLMEETPSVPVYGAFPGSKPAPVPVLAPKKTVAKNIKRTEK